MMHKPWMIVKKLILYCRNVFGEIVDYTTDSPTLTYINLPLVLLHLYFKQNSTPYYHSEIS
jgi:hypothetical protein